MSSTGKQDSFDGGRELIRAALRDAEDLGSDTRSVPALPNDAGLFSLPAPDSFPGFEILREIHRGGQGVVYQAFQKSAKRKVAIKVLHEGPCAGPLDRARFEREAHILGQLNHPNIVSIHDSGQAAGHFYLIMDYVRGQPLDVYMASRKRSVNETLRSFVKIAEAVNAAHLCGVIHRDLKPSNIRIDEHGEPHVLDFGLAKVAASAAEATAETLTGQFVGSVPWASPEQADGVGAGIDTRTDVYSLGVILYQMLTARFPYDITGNVRDVLDRIVHAPPARPRRIRREIDDEVETIVLKCLCKDRERRYQSAGELARDIRHYLAGEPIEGKRDSTWYLLRKAIRRRRVPLAFAAVLALAAIGGVTYVQLQVAAERESRLAEAQKARVALELLQDVIEGLDPYAGLALSDELLERTLALCDRKLDGHADLQASVRHSAALVLLRQGKKGSAEQAEMAFRLRSNALGPEHPLTLRSKSLLALALNQEGRNAEAVTLYQQLVEEGRNARGEEDAEVLAWQNNLGASLRMSGQADQAVEVAQAVLENRPAGEEPGHQIWDLWNLAAALLRAGRFDEAECAALESYQLADEHWEGAPGLMDGHRWLMVALYDAWGKPERAADYRMLLPPDADDAAEMKRCGLAD